MSAALRPALSMRMSSGASWRSEKPRAASSICIDETPMSSATPSSGSPASAVEIAEPPLLERQPSVALGLERSPGGDRLRVAVDRDDVRAGVEKAARIAAGAERAVDHQRRLR